MSCSWAAGCLAAACLEPLAYYANGSRHPPPLLEGLEVPRRRAVREKLAETLQYVRHNRHRMDDPHYQAQGWLIGSGTVESACKTVVGQRLKLAGMRWREDGTDALCHLRALFKSERGQWDAFWRRQITTPSPN